uniref:Uncharacterized protein n=1 Tax=Acrobeloides nanus TaxID=290746 RepID=A0A914DC89_9BILA
VPNCPDPPRRRRQNFNISQLWETNYKPEIKNKLDATQESVIKNKLFIETFVNMEQSFCISKKEISSMAFLNIIMISGAIWFFRNTSKQNK